MSVGGDLGHHPAGHSRLSWRLDRALAGRALVAGDRADLYRRLCPCRQRDRPGLALGRRGAAARPAPPVPRRGRKDDR